MIVRGLVRFYLILILNPRIPRLGYKQLIAKKLREFSIISRINPIGFNLVTAKDLHLGQKATVSAFSNDEIAHCLAERGVVPGESLYVERIAPFGDPIAIRVSDHLLCIRKSDASTILVEPDKV